MAVVFFNPKISTKKNQCPNDLFLLRYPVEFDPQFELQDTQVDPLKRKYIPTAKIEGIVFQTLGLGRGTLRFLRTPPKKPPRMKRKCHLPNIILLRGEFFSCFRWSAKRFFGSSTQRPLKKRRTDRCSEFWVKQQFGFNMFQPPSKTINYHAFLHTLERLNKWFL